MRLQKQRSAASLALPPAAKVVFKVSTRFAYGASCRALVGVLSALEKARAQNPQRAPAEATLYPLPPFHKPGRGTVAESNRSLTRVLKKAYERFPLGHVPQAAPERPDEPHGPLLARQRALQGGPLRGGRDPPGAVANKQITPSLQGGRTIRLPENERDEYLLRQRGGLENGDSRP